MRAWLLLGVLCSAGWAQSVTLTGRVTDDTGTPLGAVKVAAAGREATTDPGGMFRLELSAPGRVEVTAARTGFFALSQTLDLKSGDNPVELVLSPLREVFESVDVHPTVYEIDLEQTTHTSTISGSEILFIPYPNTNSLRNALRMMPGVVQDNNGGLHVNGASEEQVLYLLDGFNISDPLTGRFESRFSVESVRELDIYSGRYSAEFGKGAAGALAVKTVSGDDRWRVSGTNFVPGVENRKGWVIGNWTPRVNFSGPLAKGRAWFSNTADARYEQTVFEDIREGMDRNSSWRYSNMARVQVNLAPSNILYTGFLASIWTAPRSGLGILDPPESTVDRRTRQWFFHARDSVFFQRGAVLEFGYAANRTFGREIPQGHDIYVHTPDGRRGNYYLNGIREGGRDQWIGNLILPSYQWHGEHRFKLGVDLNRVTYSQNIDRSGIDYLSAGPIAVRQVRYGGSGTLARVNVEQSFYIQDSWRARPGLTLDFGVRQDWDQLIPHADFSPRIAFAWAPFRSERTKIAGGYGTVYDASNLRLFTRPMDQFSLVTYILNDGSTLRGPAASVYSIAGDINRARYRNWSLGIEHMLPANVFLRVNYLRRHSDNALTYRNDPTLDPTYWQTSLDIRDFDYLYALRNDRRDQYDAVETTVRKTFGRQYEVFASYVRSRARSNAVIDLNVDEPLLIGDNTGPLPWDAPNRFLSWGIFPMPFRDWSVAYLADLRNGFPFSIHDDAGVLQGQANSRRYPVFFEANLHFERRFVAAGYRWALRFGANNLTDRRNPTVVNNNTASPNFLQFYGAQGRTFNFRIRWLGKR